MPLNTTWLSLDFFAALFSFIVITGSFLDSRLLLRFFGMAVVPFRYMARAGSGTGDCQTSSAYTLAGTRPPWTNEALVSERQRTLMRPSRSMRFYI